MAMQILLQAVCNAVQIQIRAQQPDTFPACGDLG